MDLLSPRSAKFTPYLWKGERPVTQHARGVSLVTFDPLTDDTHETAGSLIVSTLRVLFKPVRSQVIVDKPITHVPAGQHWHQWMENKKLLGCSYFLHLWCTFLRWFALFTYYNISYTLISRYSRINAVLLSCYSTKTLSATPFDLRHPNNTVKCCGSSTNRLFLCRFSLSHASYVPSTQDTLHAGHLS